MPRKAWTINRDKFLSKEEIQRLYKALSDAKDLAHQRKRFYGHIRDYFILRTFLETGIRVFELTNLKVQDFCNKSLIVQRGKGNKPRTILLTLRTQKLFRDFLKTKKLVLKELTLPESPLFLSERRKAYTTRGIRKRVKYWFRFCGFNPKLSVHSCRHSHISHLLAAGVDLATIRDNAGHSSLAVTSIYTHAVKEDLGDLELYSSEIRGKRNSFQNQSRKNEEFEEGDS